MKKLISNLLVVVFASVIAAFPVVTSAEDNLALNKPITATSEAGSNWNAAKANDGTLSTYWEGGNWNFPSSLTVDLGTIYDLTSATLKLSWARNEAATIAASIDGLSFTNVASGTCAMPNCQFTFTGNGRYVRVTISSNSGATAAQIGEVEIFGTASTPPTAPTWGIQSVDVMKYSKDVVCNQPNAAFIEQEVEKAVEVGANYIAVSAYYDNPSCGNSTTLLTAWVTEARAQGLKIWFRMKDLKFEGDYSEPKTFNPDGMRHQKLMVDWVSANNLVQNGDIFTPNAEPQNGGINGVTWCGSPANCQFTGKDDFNIWLKQIHTLADLGFKAKGLTGVKVGYYGFDGFIVAGLGNPDWQGQSQLDASTIALMGNVAIDHYPEAIGHTLAQDMPYIKQAIGANTKIIFSEYGTIFASDETTRAQQAEAFYATAASEPNVKGINWWHLGPGGNEALLNSDFTNRAAFTVVESYYK